MSHLVFDEEKNVFSKHDHTHLGRIIWHVPWRCYVFEQCALDIVWSSDCLLELSEYVKAIKKVKK